MSDIWIRDVARTWAAFVLLATFASCQNTKAAVDRRSDAKEGADLQIPMGDDAQATVDAACQQPLDAEQPSSGCPARFDDASWKSIACSFHPAVFEQVCTGYLSRSIEYGTHGWTCYYDPSTQVLVAGKFVDDTPSYCERTSSSIVAGAIPDPGTCTGPVIKVDPDCEAVDGGTPESNADAEAPSPKGDAQATPDAACQQPLDAQQPYYGCPARFDDTTWEVGSSIIPPREYEQVCAGYLLRTISYGTHASFCYFDPSTQILVAALFYDDEPSYCAYTSYSILAGTIPDPGTCPGPLVEVDLERPADAAVSQ